MRYLGGKRRQGPQIAEFLRSRHQGADYYEPFCGACGAAQAVLDMSADDIGTVHLSDLWQPVVTLWSAAIAGWEPPIEISEATFLEHKRSMRAGDISDPLTVYIGFNCTMMSVWYGGYLHFAKGRFAGAHRTFTRRVASLLRARGRLVVEAGHYDRYADVRGAVFYLDPPYSGLSLPGDRKTKFDAKAFWCFARHLSDNNEVCVSEFDAPPDFESVVEFGATLTKGRGQHTAIERLFRRRAAEPAFFDMATEPSETRTGTEHDMRHEQVCLIDFMSIWMWKWAATRGKEAHATIEETRTRIGTITERWPNTIICTDIGRSFRYGIAEDFWARSGAAPEVVAEHAYKAKRPPRDAGCMEQADTMLAWLRDAGHPVVGHDTFEGDDIIATLASHAMTIDGLDVVIAGADKDLLALLSDRVRLFHVQTGNMWGPEEVEAKFGVRPALLRDYLAIVGDTADNISGVPGVGKVNAQALLQKVGGVEVIYSLLDTNGGDGKPMIGPPNIRQAFVDNRAALDIALRLVTLSCDAPIDCDRIFASLTGLNIGRSDADYSDAPPDSESPPDSGRPAALPEVPVRAQEPHVLAPPAMRAAPTATPTVASPSGGENAPQPKSTSAFQPRVTKPALRAEPRPMRIVDPREPRPSVRMSATFGLLAVAFAKASGEFGVIEKDKLVDMTLKSGRKMKYRYPTLGAIMAATRPALSKYGIALFTPLHNQVMYALLVHGEEWIEAEIDMGRFDLGDPQAAGSLMTYLRRYITSALLGVAPEEEEDDGNGAQNGGTR